jgi:hypothetical protein
MQGLLLLSPFCPHPIQDKIIKPTELCALVSSNKYYLSVVSSTKTNNMLQQSTNITYQAQVIHAADHKKIKHAIIMKYFHFGKEVLNT